MKHTLYITAIAAVALMLCGCQRESLTDIVGSQSDDVVKFVPTLSGGSGDARSKGTLYNESNSPVSLGKYFSEFMVVAWNSTPEERVIPDKYALGEDADHGFASAGYISGDGVNGYYQKVVRRNKTDYDATDNPNAQYWMTVQPQTSSASGAPEQADDEYIWKSGETKTFFAYANLPQNGATMANTASSQTLTYTEVPADASDQADILLGFYKGNGGGTGTAGIVFYHPLTAVKFIRGEMDESLKIKSISLEGVASRGTAKMEVVKPAPNMDETVNITWNYIGTYSHTVSQSAEAGLSVDATSKLVGEPFIIIPQNVVKNEVNVTVTLTDGTSGTTTIPAGDTGEWQAGKTNTYTINYTGSDTNAKLTLTVTPWGETTSEIPLEKDIDGVQIGNVVWATENLAITESGKREYNGTGHVIGDYFQWAASYDGYGLDRAISSLTDLLIYSSFTNTLCGDEKDEFAFTNSRVFEKKYAPYHRSSSGYNKYTYSEVLTESDDIASIALGGLWRMPTIEEFQSLYDNYYWAYDETDKGFYVFNPDATHAAKSQSKTMPADLDKSQALLFFPVGGVGGTSTYRGKLAAAGESARYWSNTHDPNFSAGDFLEISDRVISNPLVKVETGKNYYTYIERFYGAFIRPVKSLPVFYTITANVAAGCEDMGYVSGGDCYPAGTSVTLKAVPKPGYMFSKWSDGVTTQTRTITVSTDATYTAEFTEIEYVEIAGLLWATKNLGASTVAGSLSTCAGDYYQWGSINTLYNSLTWDGETVTPSWKPGKEGGFTTVNKEYNGNDTTLPNANDAVSQAYGDGWHMPTLVEFTSLYNACINGSYDTNTYKTTECGETTNFAKGVYWCGDFDGIAGVLLCDGTNKLFLPAVGQWRQATNISDVGLAFYYTSSLYSNSAYGWGMYFTNSTYKPNNYYREIGQSIRPVKSKPGI